MNRKLIYLVVSIAGIAISSIAIMQNQTVFGQDAVQDIDSRKNILYNAKFVCGTVFDKGPIRPGHYDTDISIINKMSFKIPYYWNAIINDGQTSHAVLKSIGGEEATGIICEDIKKMIGKESEEKVMEGFVSIRIPTEYDPSNPSTAVIQNDTNPLDVQVFYTANALDTLPHEVSLEKISFYVLEDTTGKIPSDMIRTVLDVTLPTAIAKVEKTDLKVKQILSKEYNIQEEEFDKIKIRIKNVSIGVGSMIDDHAISLTIVKPQISN